MHQDSSFSKDNLYQLAHSFDDILEYIVCTFNDIETKLVPLDDKISRFKFEIQNYGKSIVDDRRDTLKTSQEDQRNEFGFPVDSTFTKRDKEKSLGDIENGLIKSNNTFACELKKVKEQLLYVFANESAPFIERISNLENPRQLLGLISRVFESVEEHYFGNLELNPNYLLMDYSLDYYSAENISFDNKRVLKTESANYISIIAKCDFETLGFILIEDRDAHLEIKGIAVNSFLRRQGIGGRLLEEVISYAQKNKSSLSTLIPETNVTAQLFFQDCKFSLTKTYKNYFAGGVDGYFMARYLD